MIESYSLASKFVLSIVELEQPRASIETFCTFNNAYFLQRLFYYSGFQLDCRGNRFGVFLGDFLGDSVFLAMDFDKK